MWSSTKLPRGFPICVALPWWIWCSHPLHRQLHTILYFGGIWLGKLPCQGVGYIFMVMLEINETHLLGADLSLNAVTPPKPSLVTNNPVWIWAQALRKCITLWQIIWKLYTTELIQKKEYISFEEDLDRNISEKWIAIGRKERSNGERKGKKKCRQSFHTWM